MTSDRPDWVKRWDEGRTHFHMKDVNSSLIKCFADVLKDRKSIKMFIPLCGKSVDMKWLYDQGHTVVGVELAVKAIKEFFQESDIEYTVEDKADFSIYTSKDSKVKIYCGDLYKYNRSHDGQFDGIWDRGSFVAIEPEDRQKYADLLCDLMAPECGYLLKAPHYDQTVMSGPPHSISEEQISQFFGNRCNIKKVEEEDGLNERWKSKGHKYLLEKVFLMSLKNTL